MPAEDGCEIWLIKLKNNSKRKRRLSLFVYFNLPEICSSQIELKNNCLLINSKKLQQNQLYYFAFDHGVDSFDTDRNIFIGNYRTILFPRALEDGKCSRSQASENPIAVIEKNITLGKESQSETIAVVGLEPIAQQDSSFAQQRSVASKRALSTVDKYRRANIAEHALVITQSDWQKIEELSTVKTPDDSLNASQSTWAKYQNYASLHLGHSVFNLANAAKQYITALPLNTENSPNDLLTLLALQLKDGRTVEFIDSQEATKISSGVEGPAWLILAVTNYINETGDMGILKKSVKYFDGAEGSVIEHLTRLARHLKESLNSRHLIENGSLEITWQTGLAAYCFKELLPIFTVAGEHDLVRHYQELLDEMKQSLNRRLWDGSWYLSRRNHRKIGSKKNPYHKIDVEAQVWAVLAGLASQERAEKVLNMVWRQTSSPYGMTAISPAYPRLDTDNCESVFNAGEKHNGAINISLAALLIAAEAQIGRGDLAYKIYQKHNFAYLSTNQENYKGEPYIYPAFVNGPSSPSHGRADGTWEKNPGGWMWKMINENILGAKPLINGLKIDPCLDRDWRQVEFSRRFRGADYHIRIFNPTRQMSGVDRFMVDGIRQTGNVIKPFQAGNHYVEIYLG